MENKQHKHEGLYTVRDTRANAYTGPIMKHRATAVAIRDFTDVVADERTQLAKHPEDYELTYLGELTQYGIDTTNAPLTVCDAATVLAALNAAKEAQANAR